MISPHYFSCPVRVRKLGNVATATLLLAARDDELKILARPKRLILREEGYADSFTFKQCAKFIKLNYGKKIVLHSHSGYRPELDALVEKFKNAGVEFVGVVGEDALIMEDIIDELCVGDGSNPYDMLTSSHPQETLDEAIQFAKKLGLESSV